LVISGCSGITYSLSVRNNRSDKLYCRKPRKYDPEEWPTEKGQEMQARLQWAVNEDRVLRQIVREVEDKGACSEHRDKQCSTPVASDQR
jgi:hypothetical protein